MVTSKQNIIEDFLVLGPVSWRGAEGLVWGKETETSEYKKGLGFYLIFDNIEGYDVSIQRIYRSQQVKYSSLSAYIIGETTLYARRLHKKECRAQNDFNKSFRFSAERMSILRALIDWRKNALNSGNPPDFSTPFSYIEAFSHINTMRAWALPNRDAILAELRFVLDSLVDSGDLRLVDNQKYVLTGRSLTTISSHEIDNLRYAASENSNRKVFWLSVVVAFATAAQTVIALMK